MRSHQVNDMEGINEDTTHMVHMDIWPLDALAQHDYLYKSVVRYSTKRVQNRQHFHSIVYSILQFIHKIHVLAFIHGCPYCNHAKSRYNVPDCSSAGSGHQPRLVRDKGV